LFPFNLLNYALGLTRIKLSHYVIASYLCMLPGAIAYTYVGYAGREAIAGGEGLIQKGLLALGLLALAAFLPPLVGRLRRKPMLEASALKEWLDKGEDVLVLDVRSSDERRGEPGYIPGSVNIPLNELPQRFAELDDYQERPLAVVCRADRRSAKAAQILTQAGFADVHIIRDGMDQWSREGFPVEQ
jgi:rhodanese-related sulfurtransferase